MKTRLIFLFLFVCCLIHAQENKNTEKWRFSLSGGLGYLLGSTGDAKKEMQDVIVDPGVIDDYYSDLKLGTQASADIHYFFYQNLAAGLTYSFFRTSARQNDVVFDPHDGVHHIVGNISETAFVNYIAPSLMAREFFGSDKKWALTSNFSVGYAFYRNEGSLLNQNLLMTGGNVAIQAGIGIEYSLSKNIAIGLDANAFYASLGEVKLNNGYQTITQDLKDQRENLSRLNVSLGIRFYR